MRCNTHTHTCHSINLLAWKKKNLGLKKMLCFQLMQPVDLLDGSLHNICARIGCCLCLTQWSFTSETGRFQTPLLLWTTTVLRKQYLLIARLQHTARFFSASGSVCTFKHWELAQEACTDCVAHIKVKFKQMQIIILMRVVLFSYIVFVPLRCLIEVRG